MSKRITKIILDVVFINLSEDVINEVKQALGKHSGGDLRIKPLNIKGCANVDVKSHYSGTYTRIIVVGNVMKDNDEAVCFFNHLIESNCNKLVKDIDCINTFIITNEDLICGEDE